MAAALAISPRYLQKLFGASGETFTSRVYGLRLDHVHWLLTGSPAAARRITDIALQSGFSDVSYFDHAFKRRFGASPSDVRSAAARN